MGARFPCATRHILTDTIGLPVGMIVHPANVQDRDGAPALLESARGLVPWLRHVVRSGCLASHRLIRSACFASE